MGRCLSPCLGDLDPNLYRARLEEALRLFVDARDGGGALLRHVEGQMHDAAAARQYERAATLRRRRARLDSLVFRLGGVLRAVHSGARLVVAAHPKDPARGDALLLSGGRVFDTLTLPAGDLAERCAAAVRAAPSSRDLGGWLPADEIDEVRLVGAYVARMECAVLELPADDVEGWVARVTAAGSANGSSTTSTPSSDAPTSTSRRTKASAIGPKVGETTLEVTRATTLPSRESSVPGASGASERSPSSLRLGLPR
jgi:DNA polymerase-3 subunit epsilon